MAVTNRCSSVPVRPLRARTAARRRLLLAGLLTGLIGACAAPAQPADAGLTAPKTFVSGGITLSAPASNGWALVEESSSGILFAKGTQAASDRFVAKVTHFALPLTESPEALRMRVQSLATEDLDPTRFEVLSEQFRSSDERPYPCVRYQSIAKDKASRAGAAPLLLELDALYCRHPVQHEAGFSVIFSHLGPAPYPALRTESEAFIQGVRAPGT